MDSNFSLDPQDLTVESFVTGDNLSSPSIVETGCVQPCEGTGFPC